MRQMTRLLKTFSLLCLFLTTLSAQEKPELRVWIIPAENAGPDEMARGEDISLRVAAFNTDLKDSGVTVLNTVDPVLTMKLRSWNPAFAVPNAAVVLSQRRTLAALRRFASTNNVAVVVRFITWDEAFGLLSELDPSRRSESYPDVVQIGSTWVGYLGSKGMLLSRPDWNSDRGNWQPAGDKPAAVLPYITDARLLFYWKRLPSEAADAKELVINVSSWHSIIESIRDGASAGDTLAFPTGLTLNILHDYAPLVWAGSGDFVSQGWFGPTVDLTSEQALSVPSLLLNESLIEPKPGQPRRVITFPESSPEEVSRIFVNGGYRAIVEPANFIDRWRQDFSSRALLGLLKDNGITANDDFVARLTAACRKQSSSATDEDIAYFVWLQAGQAKLAKEPVAFFLSAIPKCFDAGRLDRTRCSSTVPAARQRGDFDGRRFWNYAGVAVPPVSFKGGSDLAVLTGTAQPAAAFKLADFLATDQEFTRVLAEAGHLPAGRPGYGIDILTRSISSQADAETQEFADNVQRAIDQGRSYPQIDVWPTAIENKEVLQALQIVWRRMAERDAPGLQIAAKNAQFAINARTHWGYWLFDRVLQAWQFIAILSICILLAIIGLAISRVRAFKAHKEEVEAKAIAVIAQEDQLHEAEKRVEAEEDRIREEEKRIKAERDLVLVLNLLKARRHDAEKFLGDNLRELAAVAEADKWPRDAVLDEVQRLSVLFEDHLVPHIKEISKNQVNELRGIRNRLCLEAVVNKAFDGARYLFEAKNRLPAPYVHFSVDNLPNWFLDTLPYAAVVILEEWFLNCIKHFHLYKLPDPEIKISVVAGPALRIVSSGFVSQREIDVLREKPVDSASIDGDHQGLPLIKTILHYAYGVVPSLGMVEKEVELSVPLPIVAV
jgi:ABC-type glycerol-3-phosphate transport system substrate-binding protein